MRLQDLIECDLNVTITIGIKELKEFADYMLQKSKEELENVVLAKNKEKYVTPDEASVQLRVDRSTLWRWAKIGYLIPAEVGCKRLYKQSEIDAILNRG